MYVVTGYGLGYLSAKQPGANPFFFFSFFFFFKDIHGFLLVGPMLFFFFFFLVVENVFFLSQMKYNFANPYLTDLFLASNVQVI